MMLLICIHKSFFISDDFKKAVCYVTNIVNIFVSMFHLHDFEYYDIRPSFLHRNLVLMRPDPFLFPRLVIVFMVFYGFHYLRFREKDKL